MPISPPAGRSSPRARPTRRNCWSTATMRGWSSPTAPTPPPRRSTPCWPIARSPPASPKARCAPRAASPGTRGRGGSSASWRKGSAEGEGIGLDAGALELDREQPFPRTAVLADELVEALLVHQAPALRVGVEAVVGAGRLAVERHPEAYARRRAEHEVEVARLEAEGD